MKLVPCEEAEATHVQVLPDKDGSDYDCQLLNVTPYAIYEYLKSDEPGFEGEEMIRADDGVYACSFTLIVYVRYLKEERQ